MEFKSYEESTLFKGAEQFVHTFNYNDYSIEPHCHEFYEINIVLEGRGTHQIESASFCVGKGDVFVIPPMTVHAYYNTEHLRVYHIVLKKDFVRKNQEAAEKFPGYLQLIEIEPLLRKNCSESMFLHLNPVQLGEIQSDFKYIEKNGIFDDEVYSELRSHTVWKIIYYLSYLLFEKIKSAKANNGKKYKAHILDTLEYIHQHFFEKITVRDLSARVYLSRSTFLRSFEAFCGCSPTVYLNKYRIQKAVDMIETAKMTKTEIAHFCGFYDLSHMERSIKNRGSL